MSRICPLFSGSKANSTYISCENGGFIVDIGSSYKAFLAALQNAGGELGNIKGIFITHEHSDHIGGLKIFLKNNKIPVFASNKTLNTLINKDIIPNGTDTFQMDEEEIEINGTVIKRFATSHDCPGSSGYSFTAPSGEKCTVCTDTGVLTEEAKQSLLGSRIVLIESNHDLTMLKNGPYDARLKARILSDKGHLSNTSCASFLPELLKSGTNRFILGHLSQNNNTPLLALAASQSSLNLIGAKKDTDYILSAAKPCDNEVSVF